MPTRREVTDKKATLLRELRAAHQSGQWAPGEAVPPLTELAARYGLSKRIVNEELDQLVAEGVLFKVPRVGTFVAHAPAAAFEFYLLLLDHVVGSDPLLMQIQHGFEGHIAQLGGNTLVMTPAMALEQARRGALPPIVGVFREARQFAPDLLPMLRQEAARRGLHELPEVYFSDHGASATPADSVSFDNEAGGAQATRHLQGLGHTRIAFFGLHRTDGPTLFHWSKQREKGWREALKRSGHLSAGLSVESSVDLERSDTLHRPRILRENARELIALLKHSDQAPSALVAANDWLALQILQMLREANVPVKRWPSMVGFDNIATDNGFLLSSMRLPWQEVAVCAAQLLWDRRHGRLAGPPVHQSVPMSLMARLTCRTNWSTAPQTAALATLQF